jgi:hypothetical protein
MRAGSTARYTAQEQQGGAQEKRGEGGTRERGKGAKEVARAVGGKATGAG